MNESTPLDQTTNLDWMDTWEHPPVRGPAVFVADRRTLDDFGSLWGGWVDPTQPPEALAAAIEQTVGPAAAAKEAWVITDQLDLGSTMIPEQLSARALHRYARFQTGDHDNPVRIDAAQTAGLEMSDDGEITRQRRTR